MYKPSKGKRPGRKTAATRALIAQRFRVLLIDAGLKVPEAAKALQVTERTVYAWISGKTAVPYSAYRLLRVTHCFELPGRGWDGWSMHSGRLWTPEGFGFDPVDGAWWSLLVRQARGFRAIYADLCALEKQVGAQAVGRPDGLACDARPAGSAAGAPAEGRAARSAGLDSSHKHFGTECTSEAGATEGKLVDVQASRFVARLLAAAHNVDVGGVL